MIPNNLELDSIPSKLNSFRRQYDLLRCIIVWHACHATCTAMVF